MTDEYRHCETEDHCVHSHGLRNGVLVTDLLGPHDGPHDDVERRLLEQARQLRAWGIVLG